jgi:hypothetical protein
VLVLSGSTVRSEVERFPYRPWMVADSIADVDPDDLGAASSASAPSGGGQDDDGSGG